MASQKNPPDRPELATTSDALEGVAFVTGNSHKIDEARRLCASNLEMVRVELPEIQSLSILEVVEAKAQEAKHQVDGPFVVEETGFELEALNGFPGALVKWMLDAIGPEGLARVGLSMDNSRATARCALLYQNAERKLIAEGSTSGQLVLPPRGDGGFGWDSVFIPDGESRTCAELSPTEKDRLSHRGRAWRELSAKLAKPNI